MGLSVQDQKFLNEFKTNLSKADTARQEADNSFIAKKFDLRKLMEGHQELNTLGTQEFNRGKALDFLNTIAGQSTDELSGVGQSRDAFSGNEQDVKNDLRDLRGG